MNLKDLSFTDRWSLFLDRDGVVNRRIPGGYVTCWEDFEFIPGALEALAVLSGIFIRIIIVSNQQGVGKGLMTMEELNEIDRRMKAMVKENGGRIDATYYAPYLANTRHTDRKPGTGMGLRAKADFPGISFSRSVMAGDSGSDIEFGKNLGMVTVWIGTGEKMADSDFHFNSLLDFANVLKNFGKPSGTNF